MASVDLLICAKDMHIGKWEKGYINSYNEYPPGKSWKGRDRRPNWVLITVPNATLIDVQTYIAQWHKNYKAEITNDLFAKNRVRITVDPDSISTKGVGGGMEAKVNANVVNHFPGTDVIDSQADYLDLDMEKEHTLKSIQDHVHDVCDRPFRTRRMFVYASLVNSALAAINGELELTLAQLGSNMASLLDD